MDSWGHKMISAIEVSIIFLFLIFHGEVLVFSCYAILNQAVAEMAAVGFGLQKDAFTSLMKQVTLVLTYIDFFLVVVSSLTERTIFFIDYVHLP